MYTKNVSSGSRSAVPLTAAQPGMSGGMPIIVPQDYHGEFLRERNSIGQVQEMLPSEHVPSVMTEHAPDMEAPEQAEGASDVSRVPQKSTLPGALYDLLIGKTGTEEETLLLLGTALVLLWGHLDRGGLFDRNTWDDGDLALLLIGYLLLS